jgi:hypothetical protein
MQTNTIQQYIIITYAIVYFTYFLFLRGVRDFLNPGANRLARVGSQLKSTFSSIFR